MTLSSSAIKSITVPEMVYFLWHRWYSWS